MTAELRLLDAVADYGLVPYAYPRPRASQYAELDTNEKSSSKVKTAVRPFQRLGVSAYVH